MSEFLIELFYEEIPALMQKQAELGYKEIFAKHLLAHQINYQNLQVFIGPRRIAIYISSIDDTIPAKEIEFKGPQVGVNEQALAGFCKTHKITSKHLKQKIIKNQSVYVYDYKIPERKTQDLLAEIIPYIIKEYVWPKSMYWGSYEIASVRPLKNILCLFDGEILPINYGHLTANNSTYGHRFLANHSLAIKNFKEYTELLKDNYVILSRLERIAIIKVQMQELADKYNLSIRQDERLLEEVAGLVEYPVAMIGKINEKFLKLPKEVLVSSIRTHQKYFTLYDNNNNFAPYFIFISNIKTNNPEIIVHGNQKVLSARLSDALYFYQQDCAHPLEYFNPALKTMVFHNKLGSVEEKTHRIAKICHYLDPENVELQLAARLCKSDLVSAMVAEFPELQGIMGYYYALHEELCEDVAHAIYDHYKPLGPESSVPTGGSATLAIADKIDSLVGLMLAGEAPTGSRDPFALRRMALGIIRIILENHIQINIKNLVEFTYELYKAQYAKKTLVDNINSDKILEFISERVKNYFKSEFDPKLLESVINFHSQGNLITVRAILIELSDFVNTVSNQEIIGIYKRINNIISREIITGKLNQELFSSDYEKNLAKSLKEVTIKNTEALTTNNFRIALRNLRGLINPINDFFDNVMVKNQEPAITNNRLLLMKEVQNLFHQIARFDLL